MHMLTVGIDIGSQSSKAVVLKDNEIIADIICDNTLRLTDRAEKVFNAVIEKAGVGKDEVDYIVATGYGRVSAPFANETVTEITCHAKGIYTLNPRVRTVIDVGGQDSKVIKLNSLGQVVDFAMNDRCAAGTGKFLEVTSKALGLSLEDFSRLYFESSNPSKISSMCTVFAESEVISLLAEGTKDKDIVAGLILAVARRVGNMAKRHKIEPELAFTGGVAKNKGVCAAIESETGHSFINFLCDPQLIGAYGAAVIAAENAGSNIAASVTKSKKPENSLKKLKELLAKRPEEIKQLRSKGIKTVGYFCAYVPAEIIMAVGMVPIRLCRGGNVEHSVIGNSYLSSSACPFACSCIGNKESKDNFYFESVDVVADAPSCLQMKRVLEVWEQYFGVKVIHIGFSRKYYTQESLDYFIDSAYDFIAELEEITGSKIEKEQLAASVTLSNEVRKLQRRLYKKINKGICWSDLIKFINAGNVLDKTVYRDLLKELNDEVDTISQENKPPLRILISGGMMAPGDDKLLKIMHGLGIDFTMDELCSGSRSTYVDIKEPTVEKISEAYLRNVPCGSLPHPDLETDPRIIHFGNLISEYDINGVIYYTLRFCDAYSFKYNELKQHLDKKDIPVLHLHSDYSDADTGQIKTRVEAFCEAILKRQKIKNETT